MSFLNPLIGGALIGFSAVILMFGIGRICGISGILGAAAGNLFMGRLKNASEHTWRWLFLSGLVLGPFIAHFILAIPKPPPIDASWILIMVSGLLVGVGTKLGSGCTSGHGVCGMARCSVRSVVATVIFMSAGIVTVYVVRHLY